MPAALYVLHGRAGIPQPGELLGLRTARTELNVGVLLTSPCKVCMLLHDDEVVERCAEDEAKLVLWETANFFV